MDGLIPLNRAVREVFGTAPHKGTLIRWVVTGVKGTSGERVFLKASKLGGRFYSTHDAVREFGEATNSRRPDFTQRSARGRGRDHIAAKQELEKILD